MQCTNFECFKCDISISRRNIVYGDGNIRSKLLFIGEAPGATEDRFGKPFKGKAGQFLTTFLEEHGLYRDTHYFITNVVKCRPPNNRFPNQLEIDNCMPNLANEIITIKPIIIVTLGKLAFETIIGDDRPTLFRNRGLVFMYHNAFLLPMYHPSYILRINSLDTYLEDIKTLKQLYRTYINPFI